MRQDSWNRFMETGKVMDYLDYACTRDEKNEEITGVQSVKEGRLIDRTGKGDGDCAVSSALR